MTTTKTAPTSLNLIAPCGINCRLCLAYGRDKHACPGCRGDDTNKSISCLRCRMKNCEKRLAGKFEYCFECEKFPCALVSHLDKRYRANYATSPVENLRSIQKFGLAWFVENENKKWACPVCGALRCMHRRECPSCGFEWHQNILKR